MNLIGYCSLLRRVTQLLLCCARVIICAVTGVITCVVMSGCAALWPGSKRDAVPHAEVMLYQQTPRGDELGRIVVPVMLNGQGPFYFLLDTGATRSVLSHTAVSRLQLQEDHDRDVAIRSVNGRRRVHTTLVDSLKVGDMEFRQQRLPILSARVLDGMDGILSTDNLRDTRLTADFANAEVRIARVTGAPWPSSVEPVKFSAVSHQLILVDAWLGKHKVSAVIDTGGAHTLGNVALLRMLVADAGGQLNDVRASLVNDATDTQSEAWDSSVETLRIGTTVIGDLTVSFGNFPVFGFWHLDDRPALLIGMDALSRMQSFSIDYQRLELVMTAGGHEVAAP